jgi:RNA 3'-terminal phosphate cyclase
MELFTAIEEAWAIVKLPKGVQKQVKLYRRGKIIYIPHSGGFVEVRCQDLNKETVHLTAHPDIKIVEMDVESFPWHIENGIGKLLRYGKK